ncbi:MAG: hypothetical protein FWD69_00235 [Polyangiaceae bacterium]|nr:hypothetical protein [Polyangiaceae bacterium]
MLPPSLKATDDASVHAVSELARALEGILDVPLLAQQPRRDVALLAVLSACGIETEMQLVSVVALARLVSAIAESRGRHPVAFGDYPTVSTPPFVYEEP